MSHTVLGTFPSSSSSATYDVKVNNANGQLWCDCRGWKIKRANQPYHCQHTDRIRDRLSAEGWRFEQRWDDHTYVTTRADAGPVARPQPQPRSPLAQRQMSRDEVLALEVHATPKPPTDPNLVPSLEQVRQAKKAENGYEVSTRQRRNLK